jgi:dephospho-CoA kinase
VTALGNRRIVLTGGIGSGKSTAARILGGLGARLIDADRIGHEVLENDATVFEIVSNRWPEAVMDGRVDRSRLGRVVFDDPGELRVLESIMHPLIRAEVARRVALAPPSDLVVVEISVPVRMVDGEWTTVVVDAPDEARISRLISRGLDAEDVRRRMAAQPDRAGWQALGDLIVDNSGDPDDLARQLEALLEEA